MTARKRSKKGPSRGSSSFMSPYEFLKRDILSGEFEEGQALVEVALAERYSVSRTPIREALKRLEQDGLLERRDRGLVIKERSPDEILDIYETRMALERKAAEVAAERRSEFDLVRLERLIDAGRALNGEDPSALAENNREFHRAVWAASRNDSLQDVLERLDLHLMRYSSTTLSYPGRWERAMQQHSELVEALRAKDSELAGQIASFHLKEARNIRLALWGGKPPEGMPASPDSTEQRLSNAGFHTEG